MINGDVWNEAITQHALRSFINPQGKTVTFTLEQGIRTSFGIAHTYRRYENMTVVEELIQEMDARKGLGYIINRTSNNNLNVWEATKSEHNGQIWFNRLYEYDPTRENTQIVSPVTNPAAAPAPTITLEPINALTNLDEQMEEIRKISEHPERKDDEVVIMVPILEPEFYPEIPEEHFEDFEQYVLETLTTKDVIVPGREIKEKGIVIEELPAFPSPPPLKTTNPGTDYSTQLEQIRRNQEEQKRLIEEQNRHLQNIEDSTRSLGQKIGDAVVGQPGTLDLRPLEELKAISGVFPFSIPWDLYNAFLAMFGGSTTAAPAPVFEMDLTNTILNSKIKIDFSEYETMAIIVRWGIMGLFVVGLIKATSSLIKW
jgi:hypothetical protein